MAHQQPPRIPAGPLTQRGAADLNDALSRLFRLTDFHPAGGLDCVTTAGGTVIADNRPPLVEVCYRTGPKASNGLFPCVIVQVDPSNRNVTQVVSGWEFAVNG